MTSRTCCSAARQSPPEATTCARKRRRRSDSGPRPRRTVASKIRRGLGVRVLVRLRQEAVPRDRCHAHVGAALRDGERDVDHREPGADEQHARHVRRQALHPAQVPGVIHDLGGAGERPRDRRVAEREQHAIGLDHSAVGEPDARARMGHVDGRGAGADLVERQPARAPPPRGLEPVGEVVAVPGTRQEVAAGHQRIAGAREGEEIIRPLGKRGHPLGRHVEPPIIGAGAVGEALSGTAGLNQHDLAAKGQGRTAALGGRQQPNGRDRAGESATDDGNSCAAHGLDSAKWESLRQSRRGDI